MAYLHIYLANDIDMMDHLLLCLPCNLAFLLSTKPPRERIRAYVRLQIYTPNSKRGLFPDCWLTLFAYA